MVSGLTDTGTTCTVKMSYGELKSGTHIDAERGNTVCWLNGECLSYETATLQANGNYVLSGLVRGQYGTTAVSHNAGEEIVRLDEALFRAPYRTEDISKTIYIKCTSMNIFGGQEQDLADVEAFEYTIKPYYIPEVSNLTLYTKYYDLGQGVKSYDVVATYTPPNITSFDTAEAWYRESGQWQYGGRGNGQVIISGCELGKTYDVRVQVKDVHGNYSQGVIKSIQVVMKSEKPNTPQGFRVSFSDRAYFNWLEVRNADVDYYELRSDLNVGTDAGLIGRSNNTTYSTDSLTNRQGTIYLYAHNPIKGYSAPAMVDYSVSTPKKPEYIQAKSVIGGLSVSVPAIPSSCKGVNVYINGNAVFYPNNAVFIPLEADVYTVKCAYVDIFGEGEQTGEEVVSVKAVIDAETIKAIGITRDMLDSSLDEVLQDAQGASLKIDEANNRITSIVTALKGNPKDSGYSAITQLYNGLQLKVSKDNIISSINLSKEGVQINGDLLHITGKTVFDDNVITRKMIQAKAVTADKISVDSLGAISANIGTVRGGTIIGTTIRNDNNTFSVDANGNIRGVNITSGSINANIIRQAGYELKRVIKHIVDVDSDTQIPIPNGYSHNSMLPIRVEWVGTIGGQFDSTWRNLNNSGDFYTVENPDKNANESVYCRINSNGIVYAYKRHYYNNIKYQPYKPPEQQPDSLKAWTRLRVRVTMFIFG